jgi:hypothetical protein
MMAIIHQYQYNYMNGNSFSKLCHYSVSLIT